jgi:carboxypeptidase T
MKLIRLLPMFFALFTFTACGSGDFISSLRAGESEPWDDTYAEVVQFLENLAAKNPNVKMTELSLASGGSIKGVRIGNGPDQQAIVAAHHGNEYGSTYLAKNLAQEIADAPISGRTVHIFPVINVSGFNQRQRFENGMDPNRDYAHGCRTGWTSRLESTAALSRYLETANITTAVSLHTHSQVIGVPWALNVGQTSLEHDRFMQLAQMAAGINSYTAGTWAEVVYTAAGTFEDYAFMKHGVWTFLFELGVTHFPSQAQLDEIVRTNVPAITTLLNAAPTERSKRHSYEFNCDDNADSSDQGDE